MALEPAGVSLEAEGFATYLKKLNDIDKKQQAVFDTEFKGTQKSFAQVTVAAKKYEKELKDLGTAERRAANEAKKLAVAQKTAAATQRQASLATANAVLQTIGAFAQFSIENAKLAAQFKSQQTGLRNLAASFGQSGSEIQAAIQTASKGTVSGLEAIQAANAALLLGVAKAPEEFDKLTRVALTLGRTMGLTATQSIEQFTTALGRQSLLILDNFGISIKAVNAEIDRLALEKFDKVGKQLSRAERSAVFMEAALNIAGEAAAAIGEESATASAAFERLAASTENLRITFGELGRPLFTSIADALSRASVTAQQFFAFFGAGFASISTIASGVIDNIGRLFRGETARGFDEILQEATQSAVDRFKEISSTIAGVSFGEEGLNTATRAIQNQEQAVKNDTTAINALNQTVRQAEQLQLSFARAAQDAALKLSRQQEDVARKIAQQIAKLDESQAKARASLLDSQVQELTKLREDAGRERLRSQERLQRELQRSQERFNLSQLQSERRFALSEKRLIAEGDILGLQQLREDAELQQQEEKENFDAQKKNTQDNARDQEGDEKENFERQQAQLLANFDRQLADQQQAQAEAQASLQLSFTEQAESRAIALQREEQDRRISQQRQLEDLGRSLTNQKDITKEGAVAIAGELENVFGSQGVADLIIGGFTARTENEFAELFGNLAQIISGGGIPSSSLASSGIPRGGGTGQSFDDGGVVQGPVGSPQIVQAHGGETILPTHKQSFNMPAPVVPSQVLSVEMSGGFNISGAEGAPEGVIEAAVIEMADTMEITMKRLARRSSI